jgi:hypothetical protein
MFKLFARLEELDSDDDGGCAMLRLFNTAQLGRATRTHVAASERSPASLLPRFYSTPPTLSPFDAHLRAALKVSLKARDSFRTGVIKVGAA